MPSSSEYLSYVLELLNGIEGITFKKMMGEYLLYKGGVIFGGIYDDRFLIKKTAVSEKRGLEDALAYPGAKPMSLVDIDDQTEARSLVEETVRELK